MDFAFDPVTGIPKPRSIDEVLAQRLNAAAPEMYQGLTRAAQPQQPQAPRPVMRQTPEPGWMDEMLGPSHASEGMLPPARPPQQQGPSIDDFQRAQMRERLERQMPSVSDRSIMQMPTVPRGDAAPATPAPAPAPKDDGGLPSELSYGKAETDTDKLVDQLWQRDGAQAPNGQPRREEVARRTPDPAPVDNLSRALTSAQMGVPYSMPDDRPQPGPAPEGMALAMPSAATRTTGSSGLTDTAAVVNADKELNWVQEKAAEWFGVDTDEERASAKTYLANWAVAMANSEAGLGAFAEANLAGMNAVKDETERQAGLDMKRDEFNMRREQAAYDRTRDAKRDARDATNDARAAQLDEFRLGEMQEKAAARRAAAANPYSKLSDIKDPTEYKAAIWPIALQNAGGDPELAAQLAEAMYQEWRAVNTKSTGLDLASLGLPQQ